MAKRKLEMYEYRQIIVRLRLSESIRSIVLSKLLADVKLEKCARLR